MPSRVFGLFEDAATSAHNRRRIRLLGARAESSSGYAPRIAAPVPFPLYWVADPVSSVTHLVGAVVVALATPLLLDRSRGGHRLSLAIFSLAAVLLLSCSAMFHWAKAPEARHALQRLDHAAIFILIAGTFTPIHTLLFKGLARWGMLCLIWTIAAAGIVLKLAFFETCPTWLGIGAYVAMGWLGLYAMAALSLRYGVRFMWPLLLGGIVYTFGAALELAEWPVLWPGVVRPHELFHLAVLAGLGCHWWFIARAANLSADHASGVEPRWRERAAGLPDAAAARL
jgi:channel protein (hemolysin III family)